MIGSFHSGLLLGLTMSEKILIYKLSLNVLFIFLFTKMKTTKVILHSRMKMVNWLLIVSSLRPWRLWLVTSWSLSIPVILEMSRCLPTLNWLEELKNLPSVRPLSSDLQCPKNTFQKVSPFQMPIRFLFIATNVRDCMIVRLRIWTHGGNTCVLQSIKFQKASFVKFVKQHQKRKNF